MKDPNLVFIDQLYALMNQWGMGWNHLFLVLGKYFAGRAGNCKDEAVAEEYERVAAQLYDANSGSLL